MTLFEYNDRNPPNLKLSWPLRRYDGVVVGHIGRDAARDEAVSVFPRTKDEHFFRKYRGYAISENVLSDALNEGIDTVYIVERDSRNQLVEFDPADFVNGKRIAYSPEEDTILEDQRAIEEHTEYHDRQRVVPIQQARRIWERTDCVVKLQ